MGWLRRRPHRQALTDALVLAGLVVLVVLVYVVLVLGGGALLGRTSSPDVALSVLATAVVALAFDPVQRRLEQAASRAVNGGRSAPYDVLRRFSETVTGSYPTEDLPIRMARVLADGTGAGWAQVWRMVGGRPDLAATWPPSATPHHEPPLGAPSRATDDEGWVRRALPVRHAGELLGMLVVGERAHRPLTSVEARLFAGLADQAGPVLRGARLQAELEQRLRELSTRAEELRTSRLRVVETQDAERRLLERNIHDGAQQHLVALAVNLRLADTLSRRSPARADALLAQQEGAAVEAIAVLVDLSRGIYPAALESDGLVVALRAAVGTSGVPVHVLAAGVARYAPGIEATAYFCCLEAVQNAAKHSGATSIRVLLDGDERGLRFAVEDDGVGLDPEDARTGTGLAGLQDRIESAGGTLAAGPASGGGTRIAALLPCAPAGSGAGRTEPR
jgi:signal transduction histidine kinase